MTEDDGQQNVFSHSNGIGQEAANRLLSITHKDGSANVLYKLDYAWNLNNTVASRTETDNVTDTIAEVLFEYDQRERLIREKRDITGGTGVPPVIPVYDIAYRYDQLGNRVRMVDAVTDRHTVYSYDTDLDPDEEEGWPDPDYRTRNNRLLSYEIYDGDPADPNNSSLLRNVSYVYYKTGDVSNIIVKDEFVNGLTAGDPNDYEWHSDLAVYYYLTGELRLTISDRWKMGVDGEDNPIAIDYEVTGAREFRYDSTRACYLVADYVVPGGDWGNRELVPPLQWREHEGNTPYADAVIDEDGNGGLTFTRTTRYLGDGALGDTGLTAQQTLIDGIADETVLPHSELECSLVSDKEAISKPGQLLPL